MKHTIEISGMSCGNCVKHVTNALESVEGVQEVHVSLDPQVAQIVASDTVSLDTLKQAVTNTGYNVK